jgi:hypothetical protein
MHFSLSGLSDDTEVCLRERKGISSTVSLGGWHVLGIHFN